MDNMDSFELLTKYYINQLFGLIVLLNAVLLILLHILYPDLLVMDLKLSQRL